ncbi:HEAT repeat domain-containing protein [Nitrospirillum sp. BR 11752]|uniref:HEAT repeat domain-containing protein n=1 Tax=Nitrospirillum sp. BR 11752 TaxID=3104293 RepID=UPI002EB906A6|nr:HEAT repeat domain-containing protein [Nitrospirillum sp. BR 11752]
MNEWYEPPSPFLQDFIAEKVSLSGDGGAAALGRLMDLTMDCDPINRDWAVFLLAQADIDTPAVRDVLLRATEDEIEIVRAEAILGVAKVDPASALPLVRRALVAEHVTIPVLEAAALCRHPSLIDDLRVWAEPSSELSVDAAAREALDACLSCLAETDN